ncbi:unnamed protein product [Closterium sp. NIES-64]|nr:unnamed protein product [Closterium sp. NIES-64]
MLSPQAICAWVVRRGSPGGGGYSPAGAGATSPGVAAGAGGGGGTTGGTRGAAGARGTGAARPGGTVGGIGGATGAGGTGAAKPGGAGVTGAGGTGAAGAGGTTVTGGAGGAGAASTGGAGATGAGAAGAADPGGPGATCAGGVGAGGTRGAGATGPGSARTGGAGAAGAGGAASAGGVGGTTGAAGTGGTGGTSGAGAGAAGTGGAGGTTGAQGAGAIGARSAGGASVGGVAEGTGGAARARGTGAAGALRHLLSLPPGATDFPVAGTTPPLLFPPADQSQPPLLPHSPLPVPAPYIAVTQSLSERQEPETCASTPECREPESSFDLEPEPKAAVGARVPCVRRPRAPAVPGTHDMTLRPSSVPQRVVLPLPPVSSLPDVADPPSDLPRASSSTVTHFLATVVTDPTSSSPHASALVAELVDFAAVNRLDYLASLVSDPDPACPSSVGGETTLGCTALGCNILEDRQEELECLAAVAPRLAAMLLALEGDPDALDIPTSRSYREAISGEYSSQWQAAMDAEMASWKSTGTYVGEDPPTWGEHRTQWSLRRPVYSLRQAPRECHDTLRTTLAALGFSPSSADPSLFLRTDTTLPPLYVLVYVNDLVFVTADTKALALVKAELQERHTCTDLGELRSYLGLQITRDRARRTITLTKSHMVHQVLQRFSFRFSSPQPTPLSTGHSLSAPPSDESVEPSGPYPELVGCLMYLMTCTRPDLAYPLSLLARYVAPGRHRKVQWDAAKTVLRYLYSTSGMGLVLGGRGSVVLTGHSDASWANDHATQRSSQGYTFSLGFGSVSRRSTRSSSVLGSSCEAKIYAGAMAAQELRWLTYLGERPRSPLVLYVNNKAMLALCCEQSLEHRTKHIALCYFLARELQQRCQLRLAYVASRANTADVFTKALGSGDYQRFRIALGLVPTLPHLLIA